MNIGIFDSGLGGLLTTKSIRELLPQYNYIYLGDTKNLPYGDKSQEAIYEHTLAAITYLFEQNCALIIIACNTVSSEALRRIQQEWLPISKYNDRKVLGVIRPMVESIGDATRIGLIGTTRTIDSTAYVQELQKINKDIILSSHATPKLVPMIEDGFYHESIVTPYLKSFTSIGCLILGCTHYGILKKEIQKIVGSTVKIIASEDVLPNKLMLYLQKHQEITNRLSCALPCNNMCKILVTKLTPQYCNLAREWFGEKATPETIDL